MSWMTPTVVKRSNSYGEDHDFSLIEAFNLFLTKRFILRQIGRRSGLNILDVGCGYQAPYLMALRPYLMGGTGIDLKVADEPKLQTKLQFIEAPLEEAFSRVPDSAFDVVLCISIIEHVWDPVRILQQCRRSMRSGGVLLLIVPTWTAKPVLEGLVRMGRIDANEIDDHKMYYSKRDLWPLLVRAGFAPSAVRLSYRKAGLVLFGSCRS